MAINEQASRDATTRRMRAEVSPPVQMNADLSITSALCFSSVSLYRLNRLRLLYAEKARIHAVRGSTTTKPRVNRA